MVIWHCLVTVVGILLTVQFTAEGRSKRLWTRRDPAFRIRRGECEEDVAGSWRTSEPHCEMPTPKLICGQMITGPAYMVMECTTDCPCQQVETIDDSYFPPTTICAPGILDTSSCELTEAPDEPCCSSSKKGWIIFFIILIILTLLCLCCCLVCLQSACRNNSKHKRHHHKKRCRSRGKHICSPAAIYSFTDDSDDDYSHRYDTRESDSAANQRLQYLLNFFAASPQPMMQQHAHNTNTAPRKSFKQTSRPVVNTSTPISRKLQPVVVAPSRSTSTDENPCRSNRTLRTLMKDSKKPISRKNRQQSIPRLTPEERNKGLVTFYRDVAVSLRRWLYIIEQLGPAVGSTGFSSASSPDQSDQVLPCIAEAKKVDTEAAVENEAAVDNLNNEPSQKFEPSLEMQFCVRAAHSQEVTSANPIQVDAGESVQRTAKVAVAEAVEDSGAGVTSTVTSEKPIISVGPYIGRGQPLHPTKSPVIFSGLSGRRPSSADGRREWLRAARGGIGGRLCRTPAPIASRRRQLRQPLLKRPTTADMPSFRP